MPTIRASAMLGALLLAGLLPAASAGAGWTTLRNDNNVYSRVGVDPAVHLLGTFSTLKDCEKAAGPAQPQVCFACVPALPQPQPWLCAPCVCARLARAKKAPRHEAESCRARAVQDAGRRGSFVSPSISLEHDVLPKLPCWQRTSRSCLLLPALACSYLLLRRGAVRWLQGKYRSFTYHEMTFPGQDTRAVQYRASGGQRIRFRSLPRTY